MLVITTAVILNGREESTLERKKVQGLASGMFVLYYLSLAALNLTGPSDPSIFSERPESVLGVLG
jgi:hypothetical protein